MTKKEILTFFDDHDLLDKKYAVDGGDSCQRMGMYFALLKFMRPKDRWKYPHNDLDFIKKTLTRLQPANGVVVRHTNLIWWASDFYRGSTDQTRPYLVAAGAWGLTGHVWRYFRGHSTRLWLFCDNFFRNGSHKYNHGQIYAFDAGKPIFINAAAKIPDPTFIEFWSLYVRGLNLWPLYPLLYVLDIQNFLSAVQNRFITKNEKDVLNQVTVTLYNCYKYPTLWGWLAHKIHSPKYTIPKIARYFENEGDLKFFVEMFEDAYAGLE